MKRSYQKRFSLAPFRGRGQGEGALMQYDVDEIENGFTSDAGR
jgi:hypothetical protein